MRFSVLRIIRGESPYGHTSIEAEQSTCNTSVEVTCIADVCYLLEVDGRFRQTLVSTDKIYQQHDCPVVASSTVESADSSTSHKNSDTSPLVLQMVLMVRLLHLRVVLQQGVPHSSHMDISHNS